MKISTFIEKIRLFFRHRKDTLSFFGLNQYVDWHILISVWATIFVCMVVVAGSLYIYVSSEKDAFDISVQTETKSPIDQNAISKVLNEYTTKEIKFEELKTATYEYPTPGL